MENSLKIEELQGLYGSFSIPERVLQRVWQRQNFSKKDLTTVSGRSIKIVDAGRWNSNEGPDFKEAILEIDGERSVGDVEIHFSQDDWFAHGHDCNDVFGNVILDVVLFDPRGGRKSESSVGSERPDLLVLLPLLDQDLEMYALEDALLEADGEARDDWVDQFMALAVVERRKIVWEHAARRWKHKVEIAARRIDALGWQASCHQYALEVLGYSRNREPMHRVSLRHSLDDFVREPDINQVFDSQAGRWKLQGIRPANHPKKRLLQYAEVCRGQPNWPKKMADCFGDIQQMEAVDTAGYRKLADLQGLRESVSSGVFSQHIASSRLNTMLCDALLPLAHAAGICDLENHWMHWYPGDFSERILRFIKMCGLSDRRYPVSVFLIQGSLQLLLEKWSVEQ